MQVLRVLNRGGFGIVEEIEDGGQRFARKVFDPLAQDPEERAKLKKRFAREVRIQSHIRHPNVMPVVAYDLEASPSWFTMPLATQSFEQKIALDRESNGPDPAAWQDLLASVEELHRLGYVHRDLKPGNVLCVGGTWVVADFGLILPTIRETTVLTGSKSAYGSHFYAAPEQAYDFHNVSEGADIFALGCILHDNVAANPIRVPFAQIQFGGPYGPIIERCTAGELRRRYPNVAALRAALFEVWQSPPQLTGVSAEEADLLGAVTTDPSDREAWVALINHLEDLANVIPELRDNVSRELLLRQINVEMLTQLRALDDPLFMRIMNLICDWVEGSSFDFSYCDVVGDRLEAMFGISPVRVRCQIVLAALELAVFHNRWHVMHQVRKMLGPNVDGGLIDRILIEMELDPRLEEKILTIEQVIHVGRDRWHPKVSAFLSQRDQAISGAQS